MNTKIIDGRMVSEQIMETVRSDVERFTRANGRRPGLAVIHAGSDPASAVYVRNKEKACQSVGIDFEMIDLPETVTMGELTGTIDRLNHDDSCDGMLLQLPLPSKALDEHALTCRIAVAKDADGFHPETMGNLWSGTGSVAPCTPAGVMELLKHYRIELTGRSAVVVGRSNIVGKPMAALLMRANATVTIAHSKTADLAAVCRGADVLVAAIGRPGYLGREHIRPGAVVIDVGINRITRSEARVSWLDPETEIGSKLARKGSALVGDVDPLEVMGIASYYTPVPGGVGPMTVAMLLKNVLTLAWKRVGVESK